jgi:hypothetical protein
MEREKEGTRVMACVGTRNARKSRLLRVGVGVGFRAHASDAILIAAGYVLTRQSFHALGSTSLRLTFLHPQTVTQTPGAPTSDRAGTAAGRLGEDEVKSYKRTTTMASPAAGASG